MKKVLFILTLIIGLSSCTDLSTRIYDRIPYDQFPENETQAGLLMIPIYQPLQQFVDWGGWWFAQEITADAVVCPTRAQDWDDGGKWRALYLHEWDADNNDIEAINSMWYWFNLGVTESNRVIDMVKEAAENGQEAALKTLAEAKTMRAFYYWLLIDNYGDVPFISSFYNAPDNPVPNYRAEIWEQIVTDLEESLPYLSTEDNKYQATKWMAYMLLSKLYLNAKVYTGTENVEYYNKVVAYCDSVITSGKYSLESDPLAPFVTENENSPEIIFSIGYDEDTYKGFNLHMRTLHYLNQYTYDMPVMPWNGFAAVEDFYNKFSSSDKRKKMFLVGQQYTAAGDSLFDDDAGGAPLSFDPYIPQLKMDYSTNTAVEIRMSGARVVKFEVKLGATDNLSNDFPIFRYADAIMMQGEAMLRGATLAGTQYPTADAAINAIRTRAGLTPLAGATLDDYLDELGREFYWEAHRRQDLIRFGHFGDAKWEYSGDGAEDKTVFPIPKWAIESNPNLANAPVSISGSNNN